MCSLVCVGCPPPGGATDWQRLEDRHACMRLENLTLSQNMQITEIRNDRTSLPVQDLCLVSPHSFTSCTNTVGVASSVDRAKLDSLLAHAIHIYQFARLQT